MGRVWIAGILLILMTTAAAGREWTMRSGRDLGEGKLLDADESTATIRFADRGVQRMPLGQLSLDDVMYVREALALAGPTVQPPPVEAPAVGARPPVAVTVEPAPPRRPRNGAPAEPTTHPELAPAPVPSDFPLTQPNSTVWQVRPDPPAYIWSDADIARAVDSQLPESMRDVYSVALPAQPSPFIALCNSSQSDVWDLWNLVTAERAGVVRGADSEGSRQAVSADGRLFACASLTSGKIDVWDVASGRLVRTVSAGEGRVEQIFWGAEGRLFVASGYRTTARIIDVASGKVIEVALPSSRGGTSSLWTSSPGGHYAAILAATNDRIEFYDLRNGALAGDVLLPAKEISRGELRQLAFSADGSELLAWGVDRTARQSGQLLRWRLDNGNLIDSTQYALTIGEGGSISMGSSGRSHVAFGALAGGWLVEGSMLLDPELKRPIWSYFVAGRPQNMPILRVIGGTHILTTGRTPGRTDVRVELLPSEEIANSRAVVAAGGTTEDATLPPLTTADAGDVPRRGEFPATDRPYVPATARPLPAEMAGKLAFPLKPTDGSAPSPSQILFVRDEPRFAIGMSNLNYQNSADTPPPPRPYQLDLLDLAAGKRLGRCELTAMAGLIGASPAGQRVLVKSTGDDRFDVWELADGKHVIGFRPFGMPERRFLETPWGAMIAEDKVLLAQGAGELALWSLDPCRLEYSRAIDPYTKPVLSADGKYYAASVGGQLIIAETATGEAAISLSLRMFDREARIVSLAFSPDGRRLAGLALLGTGKSRLLVWDLAEKTVAVDLRLPLRAGAASWAGDDVLLTSVPQTELTVADGAAEVLSPNDPNYFYQRQMLQNGVWGAVRVDLERGAAAWSYVLEGCRPLADGPGGHTWFFRHVNRGGPELVVLGDRSEDEQRALGKARVPQRVEIAGASLAVSVDVGPLPQFVGRSDRRREDYAGALKDHFQELLQEQKFMGPAGSTPAFKVVLREQRGEDLPQSNLPPTNMRRGVGVWAHLSIVAGDEILWEAEQWLPTGYQDSGQSPREPQIMSYLAAWEKAMEWALEQAPPRDLQGNQPMRGFGQSRISEEGLVIVRRWLTDEADADEDADESHDEAERPAERNDRGA